MKYCDKCKTVIAGDRKLCPLCQGGLRPLDENKTETFPKTPTVYKKYNLFFRVILFISVAFAVISLIVDIAISGYIWWSFFVVIGIVCMWVSLAIAVNKRRNIPKNLLYQVVVLSLAAVLWDYITGWRGWSLDFAVPTICIAAMIVISIIAKVMNMKLEMFIIYIIIDAIFGIVPAIFLIIGNLRYTLPSLICVGVSVISLIGFFIFEGERMVTELKRRLHL